MVKLLLKTKLKFMKNQEPNSNNEFKSEEIDKRYEMDAGYFDHAQTDADGNTTYIAQDGHSYSSQLGLERGEANEHGAKVW